MRFISPAGRPWSKSTANSSQSVGGRLDAFLDLDLGTLGCSCLGMVALFLLGGGTVERGECMAKFVMSV